MIGDEFDPTFTDWLFGQVQQISHHSNDNEAMQDRDNPPEQFTNNSPSRRNLRNSPTSSRSARSAAAPYPQPSRVFDQINRALERPTIQIKRSIPDLPNVPTGPRSQSSAGPMRRGRGTGRPLTSSALPHVPPNFGPFMMPNGVPPDVLQQMMVGAANFPNQMFPGFPPMNLANRISDMDESSGIIVAGGDKARCRHWPRCQLGARCKFHHPSHICPYSSFPEFD